MRVQFSDEPLDGGLLYSLLDRHKLLPLQLRDPQICVVAAQSMGIGFLHNDGEKPFAVLLESQPEPGVVGLMFITERAHLNQCRDELIDVSRVLRDRWFSQMGAYRVESRVPVERTQTIRCLKHMGFRVETLPKGIRNGAIYSGKPKSLCIMGLLPDDPYHKLSSELKEPILVEEVR